MGMQSVLVMKSFGTTGAYRIIGATPTQIGANFGTAETTPAQGQRNNGGRILQYTSTNATAGTCNVSNGSTSVTGSGTAFTSTFAVGGIVEFASQPGQQYTIQASGFTNTTMTISPAYTGTNAAATTAYLLVLAVAWVAQELYTWDGGVWKLRFTLSPIMDTSHTYGHTGLYVIPISNVPTIVGVYNDNSGLTRGIKSTDGGVTWTTGAAGQGQGDPRFTSEILFRGVIYWTGTTNASPGGGPFTSYQYDPSTDTSGFVALATNMDNTSPMAMVEYSGILYLTAWSNASGTATQGMFLWVFNGTNWTAIGRLPGPTAQQNFFRTSQMQNALYAPGDGFIYSLMNYQSDTNLNGLVATKITPTGLGSTMLDVTSGMIPTSLQYPNLTNTTRICALVEIESNPTTPSAHIYIVSTLSGSTIAYYTHNGPATLIGNSGVANDIGGDSAMSIPQVSTSSSEYIWVPNDFDVRVTSVLPALNGVRLSFRLFGPLGTETKSFALNYSAIEQIATSVATLASPSAGTLSGNQIDGLIADGGTTAPTTYQVTWMAATDGVANNARARIAPRIL